MATPTLHRETLASRLGFLMLSAACAIGLGNVWRFPFITGKYGGAIFVIVYLIFLAAVLPVMVMEFAIGRAANKSLGTSFNILEKQGTKWHRLGIFTLLGSYSLMMFYTVISGWMLKYCFVFANSTIANFTTAEIASYFTQMLSSSTTQILGMTICVAICFFINSCGLRRGVEKIIKLMMLGLFVLLLVLVIRILMLPNALSGLSYFLLPDLDRFLAARPLEICNAAMSQAFFTLGIGIGCMTTIGSYYSREKSLPNEAMWVAVLDTIVAVLAGMIIFPACFAFGINPDSGAGLIFITLPNVFNNLPQGQLWGAFFFLFMTFAAFSTVIAVFETIIAYSQDVFKWSRKKASIIHGIIMWFCALPCALSWSNLSNIHPFGGNSTILDLEDFITSYNILPLGAILVTLFCTLRCGWGWDNFIQEVNQGAGLKFPSWMRGYLCYVLPALLIIIFSVGYIDRFLR